MYLKVKGRWGFLSRAVDSAGQTVDFLLSAQRDSAAAKHFLSIRSRNAEHLKRLPWMDMPPHMERWRSFRTRVSCHQGFWCGRTDIYTT
jgi:transposase-like protein